MLATVAADADSLLAMWDLTADAHILAEAAEKFPDNVCVCHAMIHQAGSDVEKAMPWIGRLLPYDTGGKYLHAWALMGSKDRAGALAALRNAAGSPQPPDSHMAERIITARIAAVAIGAEPGDAMRLALHAALRHDSAWRFVSGASEAILAELADAKAEGRDNGILEMTAIGLSAAEGLFKMNQLTLENAWEISNLETRVLAFSPGDSSLNLADTRAEAQVRRTALLEGLKLEAEVANLLAAVPDNIAIQYGNEFLRQGDEQSARFWLLEHAERHK